MKKGNEEPTEKQKKGDKLDTILQRLEKIEKQRKREREDRYFFALVFALALFFITFPSVADFTAFFRSLGLAPQVASDTALFLKVVLVFGFVASSGSRYYGAIKESEKWKYLSLESLFAVILLLVFGIVPNVLGLFESEIGARSTFVYGMLLWIIIIISVYIVGLFETWMIRFYLEIGQFTSKSYFPIFHVIFMFFPLFFIFLGLIVEVLGIISAITHVTSLPEEIGILLILPLFLVPIVISVLILSQYVYRLEKKLKTKFLSVFGVRNDR